MLHRSGEMGKKPYLNNFIFIVKIPNLEPKVFTVQCTKNEKSTIKNVSKSLQFVVVF